MARARNLGERALAYYRERLQDCVEIVDIRGAGLMIGIEVSNSALAQRLLVQAREAGYVLLSGGVDGATLTLTPALTIPEQELLGFADVLVNIL